VFAKPMPLASRDPQAGFGVQPLQDLDLAMGSFSHG